MSLLSLSNNFKQFDDQVYDLDLSLESLDESINVLTNTLELSLDYKYHTSGLPAAAAVESFSEDLSDMGVPLSISPGIGLEASVGAALKYVWDGLKSMWDRLMKWLSSFFKWLTGSSEKIHDELEVALFVDKHTDDSGQVDTPAAVSSAKNKSKAIKKAAATLEKLESMKDDGTLEDFMNDPNTDSDAANEQRAAKAKVKKSKGKSGTKVKAGSKRDKMLRFKAAIESIPTDQLLHLCDSNAHPYPIVSMATVKAYDEAMVSNLQQMADILNEYVKDPQLLGEVGTPERLAAYLKIDEVVKQLTNSDGHVVSACNIPIINFELTTEADKLTLRAKPLSGERYNLTIDKIARGVDNPGPDIMPDLMATDAKFTKMLNKIRKSMDKLDGTNDPLAVQAAAIATSYVTAMVAVLDRRSKTVKTLHKFWTKYTEAPSV